MDRKRVQKTKYLAVFATTTLIFLIGILVGNYFAGLKLETVDDIENQLKVDTLSTELQFDLFAELACENINSTPLINELHELGTKLDHMENILGKKSREVLHLKDYYSVLELRQWMLEKRINERCGKDSILILYFYSNDEDICDDCEEQGFILTYIRKNFFNVNVYSFDVDSDNAAVDAVKTIYGVNSVPTIMINSQKFEGFTEKEVIAGTIEALRNPDNQTQAVSDSSFSRIS
ncbi:hypothetical protein JW968_07015 [Candidatus Woesearchaeota archaeon]|nr:hypothetical protein [Candidatus Woesearchaeota archaeon]